MPQPYWDMQEEREHALADENCDETDEDELHEAYKKQFDTLNGKPAADLPEHKWVMMRQSVRMLNDWRNKGDYCKSRSTSLCYTASCTDQMYRLSRQFRHVRV